MPSLKNCKNEIILNLSKSFHWRRTWAQKKKLTPPAKWRLLSKTCLSLMCLSFSFLAEHPASPIKDRLRFTPLIYSSILSYLWNFCWWGSKTTVPGYSTWRYLVLPLEKAQWQSYARPCWYQEVEKVKLLLELLDRTVWENTIKIGCFLLTAK